MRLSLPRKALRGFLCAVVGLNLVACNATKSSSVSSPSSSDAPASNASSSAGSQSDTGSQSTSSSSSGASSNNNSVASVAPAAQSLPPLTVSGIRLSSVDSGIEASGVTYSGMSD